MTNDQEQGRTEYDIGQIFRDHRREYERNHSMSKEQRKVLHDLCVCRTDFLGGHLYECSNQCGYEQPAYNSCRNRHCPKCQGIAMRQWVEQRLEELLPVPYFHNVSSMPHAFNVLIPYNESLMYNLLFEATSTAIRQQARKELNGQVGVIAVLHTWGQQLFRHVHVHCLITGGALSSDRTQWNPASRTYLMDVYELSAEFKKAFCQGLQKAYDRGKLIFVHPEAAHLKKPEAFESFLTTERKQAWSVYSKKPFAGPAKIVEYMGRYTHRVAISNRRILAVTDTHITFDYKDNRDLDAQGAPRHKQRTLPVETFMTLFLQHTLPKGFRKIRYFGFLGGSHRSRNIETCRSLIIKQGIAEPVVFSELDPLQQEHLCPNCGMTLRIKERLLPKRSRAPVVTSEARRYRDVA